MHSDVNEPIEGKKVSRIKSEKTIPITVDSDGRVRRASIVSWNQWAPMKNRKQTKEHDRKFFSSSTAQRSPRRLDRRWLAQTEYHQAKWTEEHRKKLRGWSLVMTSITLNRNEGPDQEYPPVQDLRYHLRIQWCRWLKGQDWPWQVR